jgi:hypothetical protein
MENIPLLVSFFNSYYIKSSSVTFGATSPKGGQYFHTSLVMLDTEYRCGVLALIFPS